jgi:hypothetical protein
MQLASKKTLEELVLDFSSVWNAYWSSKYNEGPSKNDLDKAFDNIVKAAKKPSRQ